MGLLNKGQNRSNDWKEAGWGVGMGGSVGRGRNLSVILVEVVTIPVYIC